MDVFHLRDQLIADYEAYVTSFMALRDERIRQRVATSLREGRLWPEPRIGLNPAFESGGSIDDLVAEGLLAEPCRDIFRAGKTSEDPIGRPMRLHRHQVEAIHQARLGRNYVLTTGTGHPTMNDPHPSPAHPAPACSSWLDRRSTAGSARCTLRSVIAPWAASWLRMDGAHTEDWGTEPVAARQLGREPTRSRSAD